MCVYIIYMCISIYTKICVYTNIFREWGLFWKTAHVITEADKFRIYRVSQQARDPKTSPYCSSNPKALFWQDFLLLGGFSLLVYSVLWLFEWGQPIFRHFPGGSDGKVFTCNAGDLGSIPGSGISPGEGNGNPLQYSCLENSMDGGAWRAVVHGVTKSQTRQSNFTSLHPYLWGAIRFTPSPLI